MMLALNYFKNIFLKCSFYEEYFIVQERKFTQKIKKIYKMFTWNKHNQRNFKRKMFKKEKAPNSSKRIRKFNKFVNIRICSEVTVLEAAVVGRYFA